MDLVINAIRFIDSDGDYRRLNVLPRKSLETPGIVMSSGDQSLCYYPRENTWSRYQGTIPWPTYREAYGPIKGGLTGDI